ncbi:hypothetical protein ACHMW6_00050 (plasmid) [Pseudoduganella sp. UC29_106]|uniref:hypothetical protein n=1 Tax=Pseudoduganella sp. UC29_106 TaxID=3374553 RepID=UPI0037569634
MRNTYKSRKAEFDKQALEAAIEAAAAEREQATAPPAKAQGQGRGRYEVPDPTIEAVKRSGSIRISGTDPQALDKLTARLASLVSLHDNMVRTNQFLANEDRAGLIRFGYSAEGVEELFLRGPGQQLGYSSQELRHMEQNIERIQARIAELELNASRVTTTVVENGYQYSEDAQAQRVMFKFPEKPILTVRQLLGQSGFRWSPNRDGQWVRPLNSNTIKAAKQIRKTLADLPELMEQKKQKYMH